MFDVSLVPVLVSTIVAVCIGLVWFSHPVFGRVWSQESDSDIGTDADGAGKTILAGVFQNFVIIYVLSHFLILADAYPNAGPLFGAMWAAILVATAELGSVILERRSLTYYMIKAGHLVIIIFVSAAILTLWPWA